MPQCIITDDADHLAETAATWIAEAIMTLAALQQHCTIALTGGSTIRPVYQRLARKRYVPWEAATVFFGDERAVPPDHRASNFRLARNNLLAKLKPAPAAVHRMEAEREDRDQAAREYAALLPGQLDIILLGLGLDCHTASLFPHADTLRETERKVVPALGGKPYLPRLTITPPVIRASHGALVIVSGAEKAAAVARALEGDEDFDAVPAKVALEGTWILDREAASALHRTPE